LICLCLRAKPILNFSAGVEVQREEGFKRRSPKRNSESLDYGEIDGELVREDEKEFVRPLCKQGFNVT
jgi:hypothetical protein